MDLLQHEITGCHCVSTRDVASTKGTNTSTSTWSSSTSTWNYLSSTTQVPTV